MSTLLTRRKLFSFIAAPAIVRVASIMPVKALIELPVVRPYNGLLTAQMIMREAVRLWAMMETNDFFQNLDR